MNCLEIIYLNNFTLDDCCELYDCNDIETIIEDGRITGLRIKTDK